MLTFSISSFLALAALLKVYLAANGCIFVLVVLMRFYFTQANSNLSLNSEMVSSGIVSLLANIACQGTAFSSQWILRDLEVRSVSVKWFKMLPVK